MVADIDHLPLENNPILDQRKPTGGTIEGGGRALRPAEHPNDTRTIAADVLEDTAVIREGIKEPALSRDARRLSLDRRTCRVDESVPLVHELAECIQIPGVDGLVECNDGYSICIPHRPPPLHRSLSCLTCPSWMITK